MAAFDYMKVLGREGRRELSNFMSGQHNPYYRKSPAKTIRALQRCVSLAPMFPTVERDETCVRKVSVSERYENVEIEIPLIFWAKLPAKIHTAQTIRRNDKSYSVKAVTPMPTPEALAAIRTHASKFDHVELWWVPNDVLVERIPDPDPIVVGVVEIPDGSRFCFELHRWIDESVEVGWWAREGY
jgi:hypothetical protein